MSKNANHSRLCASSSLETTDNGASIHLRAYVSSVYAFKLLTSFL